METYTPEAPSQEDLRPGIREWQNLRNGFYVMRIHYSADPRKREPTWRLEQSKNYSLRAWKREYEIDWTSPEGEPVIPEFDATRHTRTLQPVRDRRLLRFWDFGFNAPVCLFVQLSLYGQLLFLRELCPFNTPLDRFIEMVFAMSRDLVVRTDHFDAGDPSGARYTELGNIHSILAEHGITMNACRPTKWGDQTSTEVSYANLRNRFLRNVYVPRIGLDPAILVDPVGCPNLVEALSGAFYHSHIPPYRPAKTHPFKDLVDAARYGNDNLGGFDQTQESIMRTIAIADRAW